MADHSNPVYFCGQNQKIKFMIHISTKPQLFEFEDPESGLQLEDCIIVYFERNDAISIHGTTGLYSCRPYHDRSIYLHHLVNPSLCGRIPQARAASRLRCRSSLSASCHQDTGNDLIGH